jgi:alpha-tubulin suppressor-like RCC1 family protein
MAVDVYGNVFTWGYYARLVPNKDDNDIDAAGVFVSCNIPTIVLPLQQIKISTIACGDNFFIAVTADKYNVYMWGCECCLNSHEKKHKSLSITRVYNGRSNDNVKVIDVAAGKEHALFALSTGNVYAMGDDTYGQLGMYMCMCMCMYMYMYTYVCVVIEANL